MKGSECRIIEFMDGAKKRFVIPVYQRNYEWKAENCKQLFNDLIKIMPDKDKNHFFGSVVSSYTSSGRNTEFLVIDGQQRLTTISLLLLAMYHLIEKGILVPQDNSLGEQIYEGFLIDKYQPREMRMKLKPVKDDMNAFGKLFDNDGEFVSASSITINYSYFYDRLQQEKISPDDFFDAICRLQIINITLEKDDNPQLIFESLNSTGVALKEGDKIRNYILMAVSSAQQINYYEKYWNPIEECTRYDVSNYIRDYLSMKQQAIPNINQVYAEFKQYVEDGKIATEELLQDLLSYAKLYKILLNGNKQYAGLNGVIDRLNRLGITVVRPFFLEILQLWKDDVLSIAEVELIFLTTEHYIFRRTICNLPTNSLGKVFLLLHREILRYDDTTDQYLEKFHYALCSKKERSRFPSDDEFAKDFSTRDVYLMNSKNRVYALERLENQGTKEDKDIYRHIEDDTYSVEHIMPQHLQEEWIENLGEDYLEIHKIWLHRVANLTLTAYNSKYKNHPFAIKKSTEHGFISSGIRMNQEIAVNEQWGLKELEERSETLTKLALSIWPRPIAAYQPPVKPMDTCSLEDDLNLSNRTIQQYSYKRMEQPANSWIAMFEEVLLMLHSQDRSILSQLVLLQDDGLAVYFSCDGSGLRTATQISDGIFAERNTSTNTKISILKRLFPLYGAELNDLIFYMKDEDVPTDTRSDLRQNYWNFALESLHEIHGDTIFANVNATKSNWISGFFGVAGVSINCIANYDNARVELYFGKNSLSENKALFDKLYSHKSEIEQAMNVLLIWKREDTQKSSKVMMKTTEMGIEQESQWDSVAKFHGQWSKKFFDVMVPYLATDA